MSDHFKVKSIMDIENMKVGDQLPPSDFAQLTNTGKFIQFQFVEEPNTVHKYEVNPGLYVIQHTMSGLKLEKTEYVKDNILSNFVNTKDITDKVDNFFNRLDVYQKHGIEIPKFSLFLFGPPGSGKSTSLSEVSAKYGFDNKTVIVIWPTDKYEAWKVKDFIKSFDYVGVERLILIVEDIGGVEQDQVKMRSDSSLLSLLDNQEKTFKIPVCIIATTNFPEVFLGNITNRPGRFDVKIEVGYPKANERVELLNFFGKTSVDQAALDLMASKRTEEFSIAHIKHVVLFADLYNITIAEMIERTCKEIDQYKKAFTKQKSMGFMSEDEE